MRPQITYPTSLKRAVNYHEKKVQKQDAKLLQAHNFFKQPQDMNIHDKLNRFNDLMKLNKRAKLKLVHISLNFHPSDKEKLSDDLYVRLADEYMNRIGFGDQPYLVYKHMDAGHPHIHILSTLIKDDGTRIRTHNMAKELSEPARKDMEKMYGFIPADKKEKRTEQEHESCNTSTGLPPDKSSTIRRITNVLDKVLDQYKYASLQEFNALLQTQGVKADRGTEESRIYKNRGLMYVLIDRTGKAITKPIKASVFHSKPTLDLLEKKFEENKVTNPKALQSIKHSIDWAFKRSPQAVHELAKALRKDKIDLIIRKNEEGRVYGITYVSHEKKVVVNGSDLGKEYAAKRVLERLNNKPAQRQTEPTTGQEKRPSTLLSKTTDSNEKMHENSNDKAFTPLPESAVAKEAGKLIDILVDPYDGSSAINKDLLTEERRKKKKDFNKQYEM